MSFTNRLQASAGVIALLAFPQIAAAQTRVESITLEDAVRAATTNPSVGAARERVNAARGSLRTSKAWTNPALTYQVEKAPLPASKSVPLEREESMFAMFPLAPLYQLGPRASRARFEVLSAENELSETQRMAGLAAASSFFRAATSQVAVRTAEDVGRWLDSLVTYTGYRVREGAAAEVDLLRLEVERGRAEVDLAMAKVNLDRELAELSALTGVHPDSVGIDVAAADVDSIQKESVDSLIAIALRHRPDLAAATARVRAAEYGVSIERRAVLPEVDAMMGIMKMDGGRSLMAGLTVPLPLLDRNAGEIQRARAEERAAEFDRELVRRRIVSEIRAAFAAKTSLDSALKKTRALVSRAEESRRISQAAYREGAIPLSQVIDAARALADARQSYTMAYFGWRQSLFELMSSITNRGEEGTR